MGRRSKKYFVKEAGVPAPLTVEVKKRVGFNEVDIMGIVWFGKYAVYFEEANSEICRRCGISYGDMRKADIRAPMVQHHIDYHKPLFLEEEFTVKASLIWNDGARMNIEYEITKDDGTTAATGYTVQMFTNGSTGEAFVVSPVLIDMCRKRWKAGEYN